MNIEDGDRDSVAERGGSQDPLNHHGKESPKALMEDASDQDRNSATTKGQPQTLVTLDIRETPWFVWPVFVISILVGASAAAIVKSMDRVAPISLAGWRHQISAAVMLPFFLWQWFRMSKSERQRALHPSNLGFLCLCSVGFAAHFGTYFWSLENTSMTHSLFLICLSPIFVALYTTLLGGTLLTGEVIGVSLGLVGTAILGAGTRTENDKEATYIGDLVALSSSAFFAGYLMIGRRLRSWMPLFVFQCPVAVIAAVLLGAVGVILEGWSVSDSGDLSGPFGWTSVSKEYLLRIILVSVGPGIIGHAGYSIVFRYSTALLMPTGLSVQPLLASALGWALGESSIPGIWTCIGGFVTLCGTLCVSYATEHFKAQLQKEDGLQSLEEEYRQPAVADEGGEPGKKPLLQPSELP